MKIQIVKKGTTQAHDIEVEDTALAVVRFASGAVGTISSTTAAFPGFPQRLEVTGTEGTVIVEDGEIVRAALAGEPAAARQPVSGQPSPEVTAAAVREALRELNDIRGRRPITADELALARASVTRGYPRGFETAQQVARSVAQLALHHLPDSYFEEFVPRVEAVTLDEVTRVAAEYLDPARMVTLAVGDHDRIASTLTPLNLGEPIVVSA